MFHNFFFLKRLARALHQKLVGATLEACFSQSKEELILGFHTPDGDFFIKANLQPSVSLLYFSDQFHRARRNSVSLFPELEGAQVSSVQVAANERSFFIHFQHNHALIFKMHGSRSNILLAVENQVVKAFRNNLPNDLKINPADLNRIVPATLDEFEAAGGLKSMPHLGKEVIAHYFSENVPIAAIWEKLRTVLADLEQNPIRIYLQSELPALSLLKVAEQKVLLESNDPIQAATTFYEHFVRAADLQTTKSQLQSQTLQTIARLESYIRKTEEKRSGLTTGKNYGHLADIAMANLHLFSKDVQELILPNFYSQGTVQIKLKPGQTAQAFAEVHYRKAKNQSLELQKLAENIAAKQVALEEARQRLLTIQTATDPAQLRQLNQHLAQSAEPETLPYHAFSYQGYSLLVGKNANSNDQLTHRIASKNDLWLHARDTPGSHVIIRHQAGKNVPVDVLEKAAQLAAWNSKRKTDSLCPVIYTEKKYIRKLKGGLPGQVKVEKEKILMVVPTPF